MKTGLNFISYEELMLHVNKTVMKTDPNGTMISMKFKLNGTDLNKPISMRLF